MQPVLRLSRWTTPNRPAPRLAAATLLAVLEVPGILVGLLLAGGAAVGAGRRETLREIFTSRSVLLLTGGLTIGALSTPESYERVAPVFVVLFPGVLVLFRLL